MKNLFAENNVKARSQSPKIGPKDTRLLSTVPNTRRPFALRNVSLTLISASRKDSTVLPHCVMTGVCFEIGMIERSPC